MKIGIDLDGVCYDFTAAFCRWEAWDPATVDKWEFFKDHDWDSDQFLRSCRTAIRNLALFAEGDLIPGTKEAFDALVAAGHTIHIITDRCSLDPEDSRLIKRRTAQWLEDNGLSCYTSIHYTGDKAAVAKELGLDFFIDDKIENYDEVTAAGVKTYLFDRPWNREGDTAYFAERVDRWETFVSVVRAEAQYRCYLSHPHVGACVTDVKPVKLPPVTVSAEEVRVTSETGGMKGQKLARIGSLDPKALMEVAKVAGFGEQKYSRLNYLKGYDWSLSYDACQRHLHAWWSGEDLDPESGLPHLAHAAWHALAQLAFLMHGIGTDDRFKPERKPLTNEELADLFKPFDGDAA